MPGVRHAVIFAALLLLCLGWVPAHAADEDPFSIRITSPLGRTGLPGTIRIVAQVVAPKGLTLTPVRFFINEQLYGEDPEGPPYAVNWADQNPFDPTEISVEVSDGNGRTVRDAIRLEPFEVKETTEIRSVLVEATVHDKAGRFVQGIPQNGFALEENGTPQTLDLVQPETIPGTYALLIDRSQSMARRVDFVREAAARFAGFLKPGDRAYVVPFSKTIGAVTGPTDDRPTITEAIGHVDAGGGTAIMDALVMASQLLDRAEGRRAILLLTDGYDEHSHADAERAIAALQSSHTTVYVIGIGGVAGISIRGERVLRRVANATGGRIYFPTRGSELPHVHENVASDVANRYLITYTPSNQTSDGEWRAISLNVWNPEWAVRTRPGYRAPAPPPIRPSLEFTVTDNADRYLEISAEDLVIMEDGVPQKVDTFQEAVAPVAIVMALDASGSMRLAVDAVRSAARAFVAAVRPEDSLAVVQFADRSLFAHDLSKNRPYSLEAIDDYQARGGTALYDALFDSMTRLRREDARRVVVVLTDGRDENNPGTAPGSQHTLEQLLERQRETGTIVFAIGLGPKVDRAPLEKLADASGGAAYFPTDVADLPGEYARIIENLRRRYVVSYTSTNFTRNGDWRNVEIRCSFTEATIASVGGYFAPAQ